MNSKKSLLLIFAVMLSICAFNLFAQDAPTLSPLVLKRASAAPVIDGVPDEECWQQADWRPLRTMSGGTPTVGGKVALSYDGENLYAAFRLDEPEPSKIKAPKGETNSPEVWGGEMLEWFINAVPEESFYAQIGWNPSGSKFNAKCEATIGGSVKTDTSWKPNWKATSKIGDKGWMSEASIPFSELGMKAPADGVMWSMNLTRTRQIDGKEYSCLSPTNSGFHNPERFAEVWFGVFKDQAASDAIAADPNAPLRALVGCWGGFKGYDILVDGAAQLERALGRENVDIRTCDAFEKGATMVAWPKSYRDLAKYALVVLEQLPTAAFTDRQIQNLHRYVENGGRVVVTGVPYEIKNEQPRDWSNTSFKDLLPVQAGKMIRKRQPVKLKMANHPLFTGITSAAPFSIWVDLGCSAGEGAELLAVTIPESGEPIPFISERSFGRGKVLHFNATGSTVMPAESLLRSNDFCRSHRYPLFWDNIVQHMTGRPVPNPAKLEGIAEEKKSPHLWFDILKDNNCDVFRPDGVIKIAAPVSGDGTFPCEVTAFLETETGITIPAGTYALADKTAGFAVTLPGLDRGVHHLRVELRKDGAAADVFRCRFAVALPLVAKDEFTFSPWMSPFMSENDARRVASDLKAIGFSGLGYGGGIVVDGGYPGCLRVYAEAQFLSRMQESGIRTRPCWYPVTYYIMLPKTPNYDYTNRKPKLPDAAFPGKDFMPYAFHWMDSFDREYWGKMPLTDGAVIGDELTSMWIPVTERLAKGYQEMTGRPAPDEKSPDYYNLLQYRLHLGGDIIWLARSAWETKNPGSIFDSVLTPNSFAGHSSPLVNVPETLASLGCPSPDEYHYGEPKFYQKTLKSAAITWSATEFGHLARLAFTGGQLSNDYYMDFPEQVFAAISAGFNEFHVFAYFCASFEKNARQDPKFAEIAKRTTADGARIGRTLNHCERSRARVAMLYPHTSHLWLSMGKAFNDDYLKMTGESEQYLGLTYGMDIEFDLLRRMFGHVDILFDEQIRHGALRNYDVFVLAYSRQTEERTLREIRRFAEGGGTLLVTSDSGRLDELNKVTGILYDVMPATVGEERGVPTDYSETRLVNREPWSKGNALQPKDGTELLFTFPDKAPACVRGKVGRGEAILLGEPLAALKANPTQLKLIDYVLNQKASLISRPDDGEFSAITFVAPRDRTRIFMVANHNKADAKTLVKACGDETEARSALADIVTGEKIPFNVKDGVLSFEIAVKDRWGRALALLERPPTSIEVSVSSPAVKGGDDFMLLVRMLAKDGLPTRATLPFDLVVKDPSGKVRDDLSGVRIADNGIYVFKMRWPVATKVGKWTLSVSEKISGAGDIAEWEAM